MTSKVDKAKDVAKQVRKYSGIVTIVLGVVSFVQARRANKK